MPTNTQNDTPAGQSPVLAPSHGWAPSSRIRARLDVAANKATPALASMIARILADAGATVSFGDDRCENLEAKTVKSLEGLHVHIGQLTWARDEESDRWGSALPNTELRNGDGVAAPKPDNQPKK